jgi:hypothetical protein
MKEEQEILTSLLLFRTALNSDGKSESSVELFVSSGESCFGCCERPAEQSLYWYNVTVDWLLEYIG